MKHSDELLDSIAALALGVVPADEARALRAHMAECPVCAAEYATLAPAAMLVGYGAEAGAGELDDLRSARMRSRIFAATSKPTPTVPVPLDRPWLPWAAAAAAAAVIALGALANDFALRSQTGEDANRIAALESQVRTFASCNAPRYAVPGGTVVRCGEHVLLAMNAMPELPAGHVFQVWTMAQGATGVTPSVTFVRQPDGTALVTVPNAPANLTAIAVSIEPTGGSPQPTTKPLFIKQLS
ncbi:MAG: anti-sigma factor domain-containing protein [Vulcanimicrobiaceae bacterium]